MNQIKEYNNLNFLVERGWTLRQQVYQRIGVTERQKSEVLTGNLNVIYIRACYAFTLPTMSLFRDYRVTEFAYHKGKKYTSP